MRRKAMIGVLAPVAIMASVASVSAFPPPTYSAREIRATVVDEVTRRPLEGVVVVAQWVLRQMGGDGPRLHVVEAVTDRDGRFLIPAWGPKPRPPLMVLQRKSPLLLLFKHGYTPLEVVGTSKKEFAEFFGQRKDVKTRDVMNAMASFEGAPDDAVQDSMWDGLMIELEPFVGSVARWVDLLWFHVYAVPTEDPGRVRRFLEAIGAERKYVDPQTLEAITRRRLKNVLDRVDGLLN